MWTQFVLENVHFAVYILTALSLLGIGWLYFDAWLSKKTLKEAVKIVGFFLLGASFFTSAIRLETSFLHQTSLSQSEILLYITYIVRSLGYIAVAVGLYIDPLPQAKYRTPLRVVVAPVLWIVSLVLPLFAIAVGMLYLYRSTVGKEDHLKPVAYGFIALSLFEVISYRFLLSQTREIFLYELLKPYGAVWFLQNACLIVAMVILGRWVWYYLLKRLQTQLFAIYTVSIVVVFLITTVSFTGLLLVNVQNEALITLASSNGILKNVIESKKSESISSAQLIAQNQTVIELIKAGSKGKILEAIESITDVNRQQSLLIVDAKGQAIIKDEDREGARDFFSEDTLVKIALEGKSESSISAVDGVLSPQVLVRGAVPILDGGAVIGAVVAGNVLDSEFVDGIKRSTSYELTVYGGDKIAATSLSNESGHSRPLGLQIGNKNISKTVLEHRKIFKGDITALNIPYFAAYAPIMDIDDNAIGMLAVLQPQSSVFQTATRSIELTFLMSTVLLLVSIVPAYFVSKHISDQLA